MEVSETFDQAKNCPTRRPPTNFQVGDVPLHVVIVNDMLTTRPQRKPDHKVENEALVTLAETLANRCDEVLPKLADLACKLTQAHSAGISLVDEDQGEPIFRWRAISGRLEPFVNGTMPRFFSPCGEVVDRRAPQLMQQPVRHYPYISQLGVELHEVLLVPFRKGDEVIGTLWVVTHDDTHAFDGEDLRRLQSVCQFASAAVIALQNNEALRQTSARLHDTQSRMETALSVGSIATWVWDVEADRIYADSNLARFFGLTPDEADGIGIEHYLSAVHPDDRVFVRQAIEASLQSSSPYNVECRVQVPDQPIRWISARGTLISDGLHHRRLLTGALVDITERHHMEDQLRIKTEQLAVASQRKDEFLANLSHELRSPLNIIQGHTELLRMEIPGTPGFAESLDAIERSAGLQTQLISEMLDISRIITGKMLLNISVFNPREIVTDALQAIQHAAEAKSITLNCDMNDSYGWINGDRGRMQQALCNLLTNAVKFSAHGSTVIIQVRQGKDAVDFLVIDQGQGISPEFLPYVFERFNQEDGSKSRKHGGLGLGLAIVKHIAQLHGGSVSALSPGKDQGSTFILSIPIVAVIDNLDTQRSPDNSLEASAFKTMTLRLDSFRVLVVDDQPEASSLLKRSLEKQGATVATADSAASAWTQLEENLFEILISDIGMPKVNGFDLIKTWRIREHALGRRPIPAIALTAYGTHDDRTEILAAGFTAHLAKPAGLRELAMTIIEEVRSAAAKSSTDFP